MEFNLLQKRNYIEAKPDKLRKEKLTSDIPYSKDGLLDGILNYSLFKTADQLMQEFGGILDGVNDLNPGIFKKNLNGWDVRAACIWLHNNSGPVTQHSCAKWVRKAIEAGGISTAGRPAWAWKYIGYLPTIGFKLIAKVARSEMSMFTPEPGDIAVYQKGGNPNVPGHICMWTGAEWASDFKQTNMIVYPNTPIAYVFRFQ